jgi:hypothetical protein
VFRWSKGLVLQDLRLVCRQLHTVTNDEIVHRFRAEERGRDMAPGFHPSQVDAARAAPLVSWTPASVLFLCQRRARRIAFRHFIFHDGDYYFFSPHAQLQQLLNNIHVPLAWFMASPFWHEDIRTIDPAAWTTADVFTVAFAYHGGIMAMRKRVACSIVRNPRAHASRRNTHTWFAVHFNRRTDRELFRVAVAAAHGHGMPSAARQRQLTKRPRAALEYVPDAEASAGGDGVDRDAGSIAVRVVRQRRGYNDT